MSDLPTYEELLEMEAEWEAWRREEDIVRETEQYFAEREYFDSLADCEV